MHEPKLREYECGCGLSVQMWACGVYCESHWVVELKLFKHNYTFDTFLFVSLARSHILTYHITSSRLAIQTNSINCNYLLSNLHILHSHTHLHTRFNKANVFLSFTLAMWYQKQFWNFCQTIRVALLVLSAVFAASAGISQTKAKKKNKITHQRKTCEILIDSVYVGESHSLSFTENRNTHITQNKTKIDQYIIITTTKCVNKK